MQERKLLTFNYAEVREIEKELKIFVMADHKEIRFQYQSYDANQGRTSEEISEEIRKKVIDFINEKYNLRLPDDTDFYQVHWGFGVFITKPKTTDYNYIINIIIWLVSIAYLTVAFNLMEIIRETGMPAFYEYHLLVGYFFILVVYILGRERK